MADKKISALTGATTPLAGTEVLPIVQSGTTVKVSVDNLTAGKPVSALNFQPTGSTIPTNGIYLVSGNTLGIATNSANSVTIDGNGFISTISATPSSHPLSVQYNGSGGIFTVARFGTTGNGGSGRGAGILIGAAGSLNTVNVAQIIGYQNSASATANNAALAFQVANSGGTLTEVSRFDNAGNQTLSTGNLVIGTAGKGIDFSADPSAAGMTSELLDDYEEGTFTPTIVGTTTAGTGTYVTQIGRYAKVGQVVTIDIVVEISAHTGTGNMRIAGLPFTSVNDGTIAILSGVPVNLALTAGFIAYFNVNTGATTISLGQMPTGGGASTLVPMDTACYLAVSGSYRT